MYPFINDYLNTGITSPPANPRGMDPSKPHMRSVSEAQHHAPNRSTNLQHNSVGFDSRNESPTKFDVIENNMQNNIN